MNPELIHNQLKATTNHIAKGFIGAFSSPYSYSTTATPLMFKKTGAEIKEKLTIKLAMMEAQIPLLVANLNQMIADNNIQPDEQPDCYNCEPYSLAEIKSVCPGATSLNFISYQYDDSAKETSDSSNLGIQQTVVTKIDNNLRWKYNDTVRTLIKECREILSGRTLLNNLDDDTKYELTLYQLQTLGL